VSPTAFDRNKRLRSDDMGIFSDWQPRYAEHGVVSFPVVVGESGKKPAVRGYLKTGPSLSKKLVLQFPDHEALGFACGSRNRITVLDVDTSDERVLWEALEHHGSTPFLVRTGSGHFHAWYRHSGEGRYVRPWGDEIPIDVLGGGYAVAPPSKGVRNVYEIIAGSLDDLCRLPKMRNVEFLKASSITPSRRSRAAQGGVSVNEGHRNAYLFRRCLAEAALSLSLDQLLAKARILNADCSPPLPDCEVYRTASSAWGYEERGENWKGRDRVVALSHGTIQVLAAKYPDALALLTILKGEHWARPNFILSKKMACHLNWTLRRFKVARQVLIDTDHIRCIHGGGHGQRDPPKYILV
jgi:hypothetical protein